MLNLSDNNGMKLVSKFLALILFLSILLFKTCIFYQQLPTCFLQVNWFNILFMARTLVFTLDTSSTVVSKRGVISVMFITHVIYTINKLVLF